jgi:sugar lactone lactonase YvrE
MRPTQVTSVSGSGGRAARHAEAEGSPTASVTSTLVNRWSLWRAVLARVTTRLAGTAAVVLVFAAGTDATPLQTVVAFNPAAQETPENLAIAHDGTIYVSLAFASEIDRIARDGVQRKLVIPSDGGITVGVAIDRRANGLDVAVRSPNPAAAGIWRVPLASFAHPTRIAALPASSFPNGIILDSAGNLYIADSDLGVIWRLAPRATQATVWSESPLLAPTGASFMDFPLPGANGIKIRHSRVYVSNTSTDNILTIPIRADGEAGQGTIKFTGIEADEFAFAANGDLYVAENPPSELVRVTRGGDVTLLATQADGLDNPSAVAFDPKPGQRKQLYITNSAYFGTHPSLQVATTGTVGQRLP